MLVMPRLQGHGGGGYKSALIQVKESTQGASSARATATAAR